MNHQSPERGSVLAMGIGGAIYFVRSCFLMVLFYLGHLPVSSGATEQHVDSSEMVRLGQPWLGKVTDVMLLGI